VKNKKYRARECHASFTCKWLSAADIIQITMLHRARARKNRLKSCSAM